MITPKPRQRRSAAQDPPSRASAKRVSRTVSSPSPLAMRSSSAPAIQTKLTVNAPGDRYEQEAEAVAATVLGTPVPVAQNPRGTGIQRTADEDAVQTMEDGDPGQRIAEDDVQTMAAGNTVQTMAKDAPVQRMAGDDDVQTMSNEDTVQRATAEDQNPRGIQLQSNGSGTPEVAPDTAATTRNPGGGRPLDPSARPRIEAAVGADLGGVRVHDDGRAHEAAASLDAQAFTHRNHIFLSRNARGSNLPLMAHEATHVVQQGAAVRRQPEEQAVQRMTEADPVHTMSEDAAVQRTVDEEPAVSSTGAPTVQRFIPLLVVGAAAYFGAKKTVEYLWNKFKDRAPKALVDFVVAVKEKGIFGWLRDLLFGKLAAVFESLKAIPTGIAELFKTMAELPGLVGSLITNLVSGDKKKVFTALSNLIKAMRKILEVVWPAIRVVLTPIAKVFQTIMGWISNAAKWLSDFVGGVVRGIMNAARPILSAIQRAWNWVLDNIFGIDSDLDIVEWTIGKAQKYFDQYIATPFRNGLLAISDFSRAIGAALSMESIEKTVQKLFAFLIQAEIFMKNLASEDDDSGVVQNRSVLERVAQFIEGVIADVAGGIVSIGSWLAEKVGGLAERVDNLFSELKSWEPIAFAIKGITWVQEKISALGTWAKTAVFDIFHTLSRGVTFLGQLVRPVLKLVRGVALIFVDLLTNLPNVLGIFQTLWNLVPAFIRNPIEKFIKEQVVDRIPLLKEFLAVAKFAEALAKLVFTLFTDILSQFELWGPLKKFFNNLIQVIGFPIELVREIISKAAAVFRAIVNNPIGFFKNLFSAIKLGFSNFFGDIWNHLLKGVTGWLFAEVRKAGIEPPKSLALSELFGFAVQVMGINEALIFERLGKHKDVGKEKAQKIRKVYKTLTGAWEWVANFFIKGPQAVWDDIKARLVALKDKFITGVADWLMTNIIEFATKKVLMMLDPTGIMAVINSAIAIYKAIQSFIEQAKAMLQIINSVLTGIASLAAGKIEQAARFIEQSLAMALPVAISFLANQIGLRNLGKRISEIVKKVRGYVVKAIDWLIDKAVKAAKGVFAFGKKVAGKVKAWWQARHQFKDDQENSHTLYYEHRTGIYRLVVRSNPEAIDSFLAKQRASLGSITNETKREKIGEAIKSAEEIVTEIQNLTYRENLRNAPANMAVEERRISGLMSKLATRLRVLMTSGTEEPVPKMSVNPGFSSAKATGLKVLYIHKGPGNHRTGTPASDYNGDLSGAIPILERLGVRHDWVAFHILNENLGGLAVDSNLVPTEEHINKQYLPEFEKDYLKASVTAGKVVWLEATVQYYNDSPEFPESYAATGGHMKFNEDTRKWEKDKSNAFPTFRRSRSDLRLPRSPFIYINRLPVGASNANKKVRSAAVRGTPFRAGTMELIMKWRRENGIPYIDNQDKLLTYLEFAWQDLGTNRKPGQMDNDIASILNSDIDYSP